MTVAWFELRPASGRAAARIGREGNTLVAEWEGLGRLSAVPFVAHQFETFDGADLALAEKVSNGVARLLVRSLEGKIGLHASAVLLGDRAVVFYGRSGAGKSTLAAALCERAGAILLADDALALEHQLEWSALPSEAAHVLDDRAIAGLGLPASSPRLGLYKYSVVAQTMSRDAPIPVAAIFHVEPGDGPPTPELLSPVDALATLIPQVIRFAIDDEALLHRELDSLADLVSQVSFFRVRRPLSFDKLDRTMTQITVAVAGVR